MSETTRKGPCLSRPVRWAWRRLSVSTLGAPVHTFHIWNAVKNLRFVSLCKLTKDASRIFLYRRYA